MLGSKRVTSNWEKSKLSKILIPIHLQAQFFYKRQKGAICVPNLVTLAHCGGVEGGGHGGIYINKYTHRCIFSLGKKH